MSFFRGTSSLPSPCVGQTLGIDTEASLPGGGTVVRRSSVTNLVTRWSARFKHSRPGGGYTLGRSKPSGGSEAGFTREDPPSLLAFVFGYDNPSILISAQRVKTTNCAAAGTRDSLDTRPGTFNSRAVTDNLVGGYFIRNIAAAAR